MHQGHGKADRSFLKAIHYERDVNFYVCEEDFRFLGALNREILRLLNIPSGLCGEVTLGELCRAMDGRLERDIVYWGGQSDLQALLEDSFRGEFSFSDELAVVESESGKLVGIFERRAVFHEAYSVTAEDETELVCYREFSRYYKSRQEFLTDMQKT